MISALAIMISALSLYYARRAWLDSNRPVVVARVTTEGGGNLAILYNLLVENTGSRPAKNIRLRVAPADLDRALLAGQTGLRDAVEACFAPATSIPILANGRSITSSFGSTGVESQDPTWIPDSEFNITLRYEDLEDRHYEHVFTLRIADDSGFAGFSWGDKA